MAYKAFGDSNTSNPGNYAALLASALGVTLTNHAASGHRFQDQTVAVYGTTLGASDFATVSLGTNDERMYPLLDPVTRGYFVRGMRGLVTWLACPTKQTARGGTATFTGSWGDTAVYGIGKQSTSVGSKITFSNVAGTVVYVCFIQQDGSQSGFKIKVDGTEKATGSTHAPGVGNYGPMLVRIPNLSVGNHTVEIEVTQGGTPIYVDWVAGNDQPVKPKVLVANVIRAQNYTLGGSDANVAAYNADYEPAIQELIDDGLNIALVDLEGALNYAVDMDGSYHMIASGMTKAKDAFLAAYQGQQQPPPPPPSETFEAAPVYRRKINGVQDGTFWIDDGAARKQIIVT